MIGVLRRLLAEATPGPWGIDPAYPGFIGGDPVGSENEWQDTVADSDDLDMEDARLIVAAVNGLPGLLDRLEAAENVARAAECALSNLLGDLYLHHLGEITDAQLWGSGEREESAVRDVLAAWSVPDDTEEA